MTTLTLKKLGHDIDDIKSQLHKIVSILEEDFMLSEETKKELKEARKQPISEYVEHRNVLKEFA